MFGTRKQFQCQWNNPVVIEKTELVDEELVDLTDEISDEALDHSEHLSTSARLGC